MDALIFIGFFCVVAGFGAYRYMKRKNIDPLKVFKPDE